MQSGKKIIVFMIFCLHCQNKALDYIKFLVYQQCFEILRDETQSHQQHILVLAKLRHDLLVGIGVHRKIQLPNKVGAD